MTATGRCIYRLRTEAGSFLDVLFFQIFVTTKKIIFDFNYIFDNKSFSRIYVLQQKHTY